jgi:glycosyltransferase involved in cell wall biosynthesis
MSSNKIINSKCVEFGYELISVLPYAYKLYKEGNLSETISGFDTKCLYFFSPKHTEINEKRSWDNVLKLKNEKFPNINIHRNELDWEYFSPPPLKEFYKDKSIKFEKETIVIFNRYNNEWGEKPINYLDLNTLDKLFSMLNENYQIVYLNLNHDKRYFDHFEPLEFNDFKIIEKYPSILTFNKLQSLYPDLTINEIQLKIFANCEKYISSNGGQLILSAYFGGENIIFSKKCNELNPEVNSFFKWYHKFNDGIFHHVDNYDNLTELVKQKWVDKKPLINILVRTSERPLFFKDCIKSIEGQTYKNINIIASTDTKNTKDYVLKERCRQIECDYINLKEYEKPSDIGQDYGVFFKPNLYMNDLQNEVKKGYIMYLDDDDVFEDTKSLMNIVNQIKTEKDLLFWKVKFNHTVIPSDKFFGKEPVFSQVDTMGFMFPNGYKQNWEPFTNGDYRISKKLYNTVPNKIYINEILTKTYRNVKKGRGLRDDKTLKNISIIIPTYNNVEFLPDCFNSILKSIKDLDCEVLIGIDSCKKTMDYIKKNKFDRRFKFYFFEKNLGPYVIKNTLVSIASSSKILFFDSDDVMLEHMIPEIIDSLDNFKMYKPMYFDFKNENEIKNINTNIKTNKLGEGVFAINKEIFLDFNGFEGWRCAADSDFMARFYKKNIKFYVGKTISFLRRIHPNSLTVHPETNLSSKLRAYYYGLSKKNRTKHSCDMFITSPYIETDINELNNKNNEFEEYRNKSRNLVNNIVGNTHTRTEINYDKINEVISKKGVYDVKSSIKPIRENTPKNRNELIEKKKGINSELLKIILPDKPERRKNLPNIQSNKKKF